MTFSILGRCARTGRFGIALASSSPAVPARCAHLDADCGVVATQNVTDPRLGPALLTALRACKRAEYAMEDIAARAPHAEYRQLAAVDRDGHSAAFSGARSLGVYGDRTRADLAVAGNLLASAAVLEAAIDSFAQTDPAAELEERLLLALEAAVSAGGEAGPIHSAGLLATGTGAASWPITDLRVDFDPGGAPVANLRRLWSTWEPQRDEYVARALAPGGASAYGVPGDPGDVETAPG